MNTLHQHVAAGLLAVCVVATLGGAKLQAAPLGTAITYQGQLKQSGVPYSGTADLIFTLYNAASAGSVVAGPITLTNISVTSGLFTVQIDFGTNAFSGSGSWLGTQVRTPGGSGSYITLSPRQSVTATPYALSLVPGASVEPTTADAPTSLLLYNSNPFANALFALHFGTDATAIYGEANTGASAKGVWGYSSQGYGVYGYSDDGGIGVQGQAFGVGGRGVQGYGSPGYGVYGETTGSSTAGVQGYAANAVGVSGYSEGVDTAGVLGYNPTGDTGSAGVRGVGGTANSDGVQGRHTSGTAVHGISSSGVGANGSSTSNFGVYGTSFSSNGVRGWSATGTGVFGESSPQATLTSGVYGKALYIGVQGECVGTNGNRQAVRGENANSATGYAGLFTGRVWVTGQLIKGSGSFKIDHPLDPANKYLSHSFVESPDMMNVYNGVAATGTDGTAVVQLPDYFQALNRDFRYQLTVIDTSDDFVLAKVSREIQDNRFAIRTSKPNVKVSWQVTGIRKDAYAVAHPIPVEEDKVGTERGKYIYPDLYAQPTTLMIDAVAQPSASVVPPGAIVPSDTAPPPATNSASELPR